MSVKDMVKTVGYSLEKNAPDILIWSGVGGVIASMFLIGRASTKLSDVTDEMVDKLDLVEDALLEDDNDYDVEKANGDKRKIRISGGIAIAKLYAPGIIVGGIGIGCIFKSHNILKNRHISLNAAYTTLAVGFAAYQERVSERFGDDVEKEIRYNIKSETVEETIINEKGKEKVVTKEVKTASATQDSPFVCFFEQSNSYWEKDQQYNMAFLTSKQQYVNDLLRVNKKVYLDYVLDLLGIELSEEEADAAHIVGWIYDPKNPNHKGDNYIDFGITELTLKQEFKGPQDKRNPKEPVILLDFNVDKECIWKDKSKGVKKNEK